MKQSLMESKRLRKKSLKWHPILHQENHLSKLEDSKGKTRRGKLEGVKNLEDHLTSIATVKKKEGGSGG